MLSRFVALFRRDFPDLVGRPVLVALSGGADSVALVYLLHAAHDELGCLPVVAHVHHHARGAEADGDAQFCAQLCARMGLRFRLVHLERSHQRGWSPEAWWRRERYRLLDTLARELGCPAVATAHTLDDQAETVLLKLLRGSGPRGVAGVRRRAGTVFRPLLGFPRETVRRWLADQGARWREDASNADTRLPRAWLRHELLPRIATRYPGAAEHLAAFALMLAGDEEHAAALVRMATWPEIGRPVFLGLVRGLAPGPRRRWVLELAARLPLERPPSRDQLDLAERVIDLGIPPAVDLGKRWLLRRRGLWLYLCPPPVPTFAPVAARFESEECVPGGFVLRLGSGPGTSGRHAAWLQPRVAERELLWRTARPGERFPMDRPRRIKDLLARAGVPTEWRHAWPILCAGDTIVWLPGVGVAQSWEAAPGSGVLAEMEEPWEFHGR